MVVESPQKMLSEMGVRSMVGSGGDGFAGDEIEKELGLLLREHRRQEASSDPEKELNIFRSGSAPPTVEGSLNAVGGLFGRDIASAISEIPEAKNGTGFPTEQELLASPEYLSYYYSHVNLNPRLPPPVLSKEDWRSTQRLQVGGSSVWGGIGDRRNVSRGVSLFSQPPGFKAQEVRMPEPRKAPDAGEWMDKGDGLIGLSLGHQKSFADILQDDLGHKTPISSHPSRSASRNAFANGLESLGSSDAQLALNNAVASSDGQPGDYVQSANGLHSFGMSSSHTFGSSIRRSTTPDAQVIARVPSPLLPVGARSNSIDIKESNSSLFDGVSSGTVKSDDLIAAMSGISLSSVGARTDDISHANLERGFDDQQNFLFASQSVQANAKAHQVMKNSDPEYISMASIQQSLKSNYPSLAKTTGGFMDRNQGSKLNGPLGTQRSPSANSYLKASLASSVATSGGSPMHYQNLNSVDAAFSNYGLNTYSSNPTFPSFMGDHVGTETLPSLFDGAAAASGITLLGRDARASGGSVFSPTNIAGLDELQALNRIGNQAAAATLQTPLNDPLYVQYLKAAEYTAQVAASFGDTSMDGCYLGNSYSDLAGIQKAYLGSLLQQQKQYGMPVLSKSGSLNQGYYGNPAFGLGLSYLGSPLATSVASPVGPGSPLRLGERNMRLPSNFRSLSGGVLGSWHSDPLVKMDEHFPSSLLEEFKGNKTRCFELAEIAGHVVEFSADQYGSRFIQQKLETASTEEKNMVFEEIMPHALSLMTDVFGNYVVQKFFEHGSAAQRRELANQLNGHVLALSLQMYGCRVIQKAIEVVDLDQKTKMVLELDGHIMRCVRDQNGNHVIQKCIECVPQESIQFIISTFYDQVVTLSTHPYGCRVIQRVLEHCDDPKTQQIVMDEILQNVCMLAEDQYGNYVVQHVLEHGKPHERSAIIKKLAGQIVHMSQQKFASNVVEKCLTFGGLEERQLLVSEMLGTTDENEPLQAMMKDQFANYVVQKVLETCDDQQRELILSRIKVHLSALKKYTYGKHIVARVEKLVAAGERRLGMQSS